MIELSLLYKLLDTDTEYGVHGLLRAAYRQSYCFLPELVVSVAASEGARLSAAARGLIERAEGRIADYSDLYAHVREAADVQLLKGDEIARYYPHGIVRAAGDVDLVAADEENFWRTACEIVDRRRISQIGFTVVGGSRRHLLMTLEWPAADEVLECARSADLSTAAFTQRLGVLPIQPEMPVSRWIACLLAIAEERFQRDFRLRDVVDVLALSGSAPEPAEIVRAITDWRLAPEVSELLHHAREYIELGRLTAVLDELEPLVENEQSKRAEAPIDPDRSPPEHVRFGMPLGEPCLRASRSRLETHAFDQGLVALTPVGEFLLVDTETVDPESYSAALAEVGRMMIDT